LGKDYNQMFRTMSTTTIDTRPLFQLTVVEFQDLLAATIPGTKDEPTIVPERIRIYGIRGLATYLSVSVPTAQRLKNAKKFPFYEAGNKLIFYSDEVDNGLKVESGGRK